MATLVFTTTPSPRSQATSDLFRQYKLLSQTSAPVRDAALYPVSSPTSFASIFAPQVLVLKMQSLLTSAEYDASKGVNFQGVIGAKPIVNSLFRPPPVIVSFGKDNLKDSVQAQMLAIGFRKESQARRQFYKGEATGPALLQCAQMGADLDAYAPYGTCNIRGFSAFNTVQNLFLTAASLLPASSNDLNEKWCLTKVEAANIAIKKSFSRKITGPSIAFPYFSGLCLPDKLSVPDIIARRFIKLLGATPAEASKKLETIRKGWVSLSTTPVGIELSHMAYIIDLGISLGAAVKIIMVNGSYGGVVLLGEDLKVSINGTLVQSQPAKEVVAALKNLDQHASALESIVDMLNPKLFGTKTDSYISSAVVTSARFLHNLIASVVFSGEDMSTLRQHVLCLKFQQTYYSLQNNDHVLTVIDAIINGKSLPDDAPIAYRTEAFFTKDKILSSLAAFGTTAPSIIGLGTTRSYPVVGVETLKEKMGGKKSAFELPGFPLFYKPLQQAFEDWVSLKASSVIHFRTKINRDKQEVVLNVGRFLPFDEEGKKVNKLIASWSTKKQEKAKRSRDEESDDEEPAHKRVKSKKSIVDGISGLDLGIYDDAYGGLEMDED